MKNGDLTEEDMELWEELGVKGAKRIASRKAVRKIIKEKTTEKPGGKHKDGYNSKVGGFTAKQIRGKLPYLEVGESPDVDSNTANRLRNGEMKVEAILDLHGCVQKEAYDMLVSLINECYLLKKRCILVITGKGGNYGSGGVLRSNLPKWLNSADVREKVLMFAQAKPKDGGEGAFYILIKRNR